MITKSSQRGGGPQLATHLLNEFDNERTELADLRGAAAPQLHGAFHEWYAQSLATKCEKFLYHLVISPDVARYHLTRQQYFDFIGRVERSLKLVGQPRAVVFHVKEGREHAHVVWSRIDPDAGKAVHIAHDALTRRRITQEFARDHGLPLPEVMRQNGHKDRFNNKAKQSDHAEAQQEERSGIPKEKRRDTILQVWKDSPNDHAFVKGLAQAGYILARGDSRAYIVVDLAGDAHSLSRQLTPDVKAPQLKSLLLANYAPEKLPDVETAKAAAQKQREALKEKKAQEQSPAQKTAQNDNTATPSEKQKAELDEIVRQEKDIAARRAALGRLQEERRSKLAQHRTDLGKRFEAELQGLGELHASEDRGVLSARAFQQPKGLRAFLMRITGFEMLISRRHRREDAVRAASQKRQKEALQNRHARERHDFDRQYRNLAALEKRERHSLETALKREEFQRIVAPEKSRLAPQHAPVTDRVVLKPDFDRAAGLANNQRGSDGDRLAGIKGRSEQDFAKASKVPEPVAIKPEFDRVAGLANDQRGSDGDRLAAAKGRAAQDFAKASKVPEPVIVKPEFDRVAGLANAQSGADTDRLAAAKGRAAQDFAKASKVPEPMVVKPEFNRASGAAEKPAQADARTNGKANPKPDFTAAATPQPKKPDSAPNEKSPVAEPVPLKGDFNTASGGQPKEPLPDSFNRAANGVPKSDTDAHARAQRIKEEIERRQRENDRSRPKGGPDWGR